MVLDATDTVASGRRLMIVQIIPLWRVRSVLQYAVWYSGENRRRVFAVSHLSFTADQPALAAVVFS